jgi:hypothetical protein
MPALPLDEAGKYVAGAYVAFLGLVLIYLTIMATRLSRFERELAELAELARQRVQPPRAEVAQPDLAPAGGREERP